MLEKLVEDDICVGIFSELDDNPYAFPVTLVPDICDAVYLLKLNKLCDLDLQISLVDHVRKLGNDDL